MSDTNPVVLLAGDDAIGRELERQRRIDIIKKQHGQLIVHLFDSTIESIAAFFEHRMTISLFPEPRLFMIRHANGLSDSELKIITANLANDAPETYLIMEADVIASKKDADTPARFATWAKKFIELTKEKPDFYTMAEFPKPRDWEIAPWLMENSTRIIKRSIGKAEAEHFIDLAGTNLTSLYSELLKIDLHLPPKSPITREAIDEVIGAARAASPFELAEALGKKDLVRALELVESLFLDTFAAPPVIWALFRHFWALFRIRQYAKVNKQQMTAFMNTKTRFNKPVQDEVGLAIGLASGLLKEHQKNRVYPAIVKSGIVDQARLWQEDELMQVIKVLHDVDIGSKTGRLTIDKGAMQQLCYSIVRSKETRNAA